MMGWWIYTFTTTTKMTATLIPTIASDRRRQDLAALTNFHAPLGTRIMELFMNGCIASVLMNEMGECYRSGL